MAKAKNTNGQPEQPEQGILPGVNAAPATEPDTKPGVVDLGTLTSQPVVRRAAVSETLPDGTIKVDY